MTKCGKCFRVLRGPKSIQRGYGRHCHKVVQATIADLENAMEKDRVQKRYVDQFNKAIELIELNAIRATWRKGVYLVKSMDGTRTYRTSVTGQCTCPHGVHRFRAVPGLKVDGTTKLDVCYHVGSARIIYFRTRHFS